LIKEEELQRARGLLQQALMASHMTGDDPRTVSMAHGTSTARPLYSTTRVSEALFGASELLMFDVPHVQTTSVVSHTEPPTLLSSRGSTLTRLPPISQLGYNRPTMVASGITGVSTTPLSLPTLMAPSVSTSITPITHSYLSSTVPSSSAFTPVQRRGKAPPIDPFTGENPEIRLDDWLPTLERASVWNGWSEEETLLQLAGYLRNRALQEWNLLSGEDRGTYESAVKALQACLDPGNQTLAALDFRHAVQGDSETVADYIRWLEHIFQIGFGKDRISLETRNVLLYSQLQSGLVFELSKAPAVSGAKSYSELCLAARNEEKRLAELKKLQQYGRGQQKYAR